VRALAVPEANVEINRSRVFRVCMMYSKRATPALCWSRGGCLARVCLHGRGKKAWPNSLERVRPQSLAPAIVCLSSAEVIERDVGDSRRSATISPRYWILEFRIIGICVSIYFIRCNFIRCPILFSPIKVRTRNFKIETKDEGNDLAPLNL